MVLSERQEQITRIYVELGFLKENDIDIIIKERRVEELRDIAKDIQFDELDEYIQRVGALGIKWGTFAKEYLLIFLLYVNQAGISDYKIFEEREFFRRSLEEFGSKEAKRIAKLMKYKELCEMTLEEFMGLEV